MTVSTRAAVALSCALLLSTAAETRADTVKCTATAGLEKREAATSSTGIERTGSYEVSVSSGAAGAGTVMVAIEAKKDVRTEGPTKVAAPIDSVLVRSPFKSEAIAQSKTFVRGAVATDGVATFDASAVSLLPKGDVEVIIVTADGERLCRIKSTDRQRLVAGVR